MEVDSDDDDDDNPWKINLTRWTSLEQSFTGGITGSEALQTQLDMVRLRFLEKVYR